MDNTGSVEHASRGVRTAGKCGRQTVAAWHRGPGKTARGKASRRLSFAALSLVAAACPAFTADVLPTGGSVVAGGGVISQSGAAMTIDQSTSRLAIDWGSFSIGERNSVNFVQPSASSIALNRVLGSDVSLIQGNLTANGQVFLINPNGVLFTPTAQVNVSGLIASTLNLSNAEFMAGNYKFNGTSSNAIINQGNITAANGGTIALIAAKITNDGNLTAHGGNVLLGAGTKVTLDLGGPVKLQVDQGAIDAMIRNGGAIRADGGLVYLTARAAGDLASTVINNTGIIEAQTLARGETGRIVLLGGMESDAIVVGGTLDASAPNGSDGGFIETSAANVQIQDGIRVSAAAPHGTAGKWLIDPTDITISAGSCTGTNCIAANTIASTLIGGTDVAIATSAAGAGAGNIAVNAPISWSSNRLTLAAHNNININATLDATATGSLAFQYGQGTANGGSSTYVVAPTARIYIADAPAFTWQKGSGGAVSNLVFNNGLLRFGNGTQASINSVGQLEQPFYFDNTSVVGGTQRNGWFQLTFSNYPLDLEAGVGGDGTSSWNRNGVLLNTQTNLAAAVSGRSLEISAFKEGVGSIVSSINLGFSSGASLKVENTYTLDAGVSFLKTDTALTNLGGTTASNVRLWVGTRDDYIATRDSQFKFKGNLTASGFEQILTQDTQSKALKITEFNDGQGAAVLFYSISDGADTSIEWCCSFSNATGIDPRTSLIFRGQSGGLPSAEDGSYALFIRLPDLASGQSAGMTWYYAAGPVSLLDSIVSQVTTSVAEAATAPAPPPPGAVIPAIDSAISSVQGSIFTSGSPSPATTSLFGIPAPAPGLGLTYLGTSGGLSFVGFSLDDGGNVLAAGDTTGLVLPAQDSGTDAAGFMTVFVVGGGVRLPEEAEDEEEKRRRQARILSQATLPLNDDPDLND